MARPIIDPKAKLAKKIRKASQSLRTRLPSPWPVRDASSPWIRREPAYPFLDTATALVLAANGADTKLSAAAATVSREGSGIAGDDPQSAKSFSVKQGRVVQVTGPDGVKHSVRIVGPAL